LSPRRPLGGLISEHAQLCFFITFWFSFLYHLFRECLSITKFNQYKTIFFTIFNHFLAFSLLFTIEIAIFTQEILATLLDRRGNNNKGNNGEKGH